MKDKPNTFDNSVLKTIHYHGLNESGFHMTVVKPKPEFSL